MKKGNPIIIVFLAAILAAVAGIGLTRSASDIMAYLSTPMLCRPADWWLSP